MQAFVDTAAYGLELMSVEHEVPVVHTRYASSRNQEQIMHCHTGIP